MLFTTSKTKSLPKDFIASSHVYIDELSEETIEKIKTAAAKLLDDELAFNATNQKSKSRR